MIISLGQVDVSGWGTVLSYIFKSSINSGVVAMVGGLIIVPIVSLFTKKPSEEKLNELFACYDEKVLVKQKDALEEAE